MRRALIALVAVVVIGVGIWAIAASGGDDDNGDSATAGSTKPSGSVRFWVMATYLAQLRIAVIKGELSASEDLTLYGQMEGSVTLPNRARSIGADANIKASISQRPW